jgi:hypothetical protein
VGNRACLDEGGMYARVSEWIDGVAPTTSADTSLAGWLGRTVAVIEHLALPGDQRAEAAYPVQSVADWRLWLDEARAAGMLDVRQARGLSAAVTDATALMQAALAADHVFQLAHRDVNRRNILRADRGPLLLDFDYAGTEVPWWEFVHHAFDLASPRLGDYPPRPEQVDAALTAYQETGASAGTAEPEALPACSAPRSAPPRTTCGWLSVIDPRPRGPGRDLDDLHVLGGKDRVSVFRVPIADEESEGAGPLAQIHQQITACCAVHAAVGCTVVPRMCTVRVPTSITKST